MIQSLPLFSIGNVTRSIGSLMGPIFLHITKLSPGSTERYHQPKMSHYRPWGNVLGCSSVETDVFTSGRMLTKEYSITSGQIKAIALQISASKRILPDESFVTVLPAHLLRLKDNMDIAKDMYNTFQETLYKAALNMSYNSKETTKHILEAATKLEELVAKGKPHEELLWGMFNLKQSEKAASRELANIKSLYKDNINILSDITENLINEAQSTVRILDTLQRQIDKVNIIGEQALSNLLFKLDQKKELDETWLQYWIIFFSYSNVTPQEELQITQFQRREEDKLGRPLPVLTDIGNFYRDAIMQLKILREQGSVLIKGWYVTPHNEKANCFFPAIPNFSGDLIENGDVSDWLREIKIWGEYRKEFVNDVKNAVDE